MLLCFFHFFYLTPPVFDHASSPSCSACLSVFNSPKKGGSEDRGDITSHPHPFLATVGITWEAYRTPPFCLLLLPSFLVCEIKLYKMAIYCKCVANCGCAYTITSSLAPQSVRLPGVSDSVFWPRLDLDYHSDGEAPH